MDAYARLREAMLASWRTNNRTTVFLVKRVPDTLWDAKVPGAPGKTVRMLLAHMHNVRCRWMKALGSEHGLMAPASVDRRAVGMEGLVGALGVSGAGMRALLVLGLFA